MKRMKKWIKKEKNWRVAAAELIPQYLSASSGSSWLYLSFFCSKKILHDLLDFLSCLRGGAFSSSHLKGLDI
jgi:hypothetical protein